MLGYHHPSTGRCNPNKKDTSKGGHDTLGDHDGIEISLSGGTIDAAGV
jgi:hypothetical protein